jgi:protein TonB
VISGHPLLVQAAIEAVKQWEYKPTVLKGQPVEVAVQAEVPFGIM